MAEPLVAVARRVPWKRVVAVVAAVVCWLVVYTVATVGLFLFLFASVWLDRYPEWVIQAIVAVWAGAAIVVATRVAAVVLARRDVGGAAWLLVLPTAAGVSAVVGADPGEVGDVWWLLAILYGGGIAGAFLAVTRWELPAARVGRGQRGG